MSLSSDESTWMGRRAMVLFGLSISMGTCLFSTLNCAKSAPPDPEADNLIDRETPLREEADAIRVLREQ